MRSKLEMTKILRYAKKAKAINYLGGKCIICGEKNQFKLAFHHRNINEKEFQYCDNDDMRWSSLKKELDKCDVLCQNCHREVHYEKIPKYNATRRNDKNIYLEYAGSECIICGYSKCPAALTFHHRDPNTKEFWIGGLSERINSLNELSDIIKDEIDKCDILCANCHTVEHSDVEFYNKFNVEINKKTEDYKEIQPRIDRELVKKMYNDGIRQIDISKHFSASKSTISLIIKSLGLKK